MKTKPSRLSHSNFPFKAYKNKIWCIAVLFSLFVAVASNGTSWASTTPKISAGSGHTAALKSDGTVWAWGYNSEGQLGDGTTTDKHSPVQVNGLNLGISTLPTPPQPRLQLKQTLVLLKGMLRYLHTLIHMGV